MTTHTSIAAGTSQKAKILARLRLMPGFWVPMPALYRASGAMAVHSRIADLRADGHVIEQQNRRGHGTSTHSYYRLLPGVAADEAGSIS